MNRITKNNSRISATALAISVIVGALPQPVAGEPTRTARVHQTAVPAPHAAADGLIDLVSGIDVLSASGIRSLVLWVDGILRAERKAKSGPSRTSGGDAAFADASPKGVGSSGIDPLPGQAPSSGESDFDTGLESDEGVTPELRITRGPAVESVMVDRVMSEVVVTWRSEVGATYAVEESSDLSGWTEIARDLAGSGDVMSYARRFASSPLPRAGFYRIRQQLPGEVESVGGFGCCCFSSGGSGGEE